MTEPHFASHRLARFASRRERIRAVLERDPALEAWQLAERFGMTVCAAQDEITQALQSWRKPERGREGR